MSLNKQSWSFIYTQKIHYTTHSMIMRYNRLKIKTCPHTYTELIKQLLHLNIIVLMCYNYYHIFHEMQRRADCLFWNVVETEMNEMLLDVSDQIIHLSIYAILWRHHSIFMMTLCYFLPNLCGTAMLHICPGTVSQSRDCILSSVDKPLRAPRPNLESRRIMPALTQSECFCLFNAREYYGPQSSTITDVLKLESNIKEQLNKRCTYAVSAVIGAYATSTNRWGTSGFSLGPLPLLTSLRPSCMFSHRYINTAVAYMLHWCICHVMASFWITNTVALLLWSSLE